MAPTTTNTKPKAKLHGLYQALQALRLIHPEMPLQMAMVFLYVAMNEGSTMTQVADAIGIAQSSCSRLVATMGKTYRQGGESNLRDGFELMTAEDDPYERRRKIVRLTPKGHRLVEQLVAHVS
jgi:DNA-binding MarR family transcriptional regulator